MLSQLNALIGFAAIFGLLSLLVTGIVQLIRSRTKIQTLKLEHMLLNLFGELKDAPRFVAAILSHPALEGNRGKLYFDILTAAEEASNSDKVRHAWETVLRASKMNAAYPWPRTQDLDKQAIKDIGQLVYDRIGHLVDCPLKEPELKDMNQEAFRSWAINLKRALDEEDRQHLKLFAANGINERSSSQSPGSAVVPFRGRLWMTAAAAFPEADGRVPPLKTYVAAFYEKASASASDAFTNKMRGLAIGVSVLLAVSLNLDAVKLWNSLATADPQRISQLADQAQKALKESTMSDQQDAGDEIEQLKTVATALQMTGFLSPQESNPVAFFSALKEEGWSHIFGFFLAVTALSLGAPFWFEMLKSGIGMRSAFSKNSK